MRIGSVVTKIASGLKCMHINIASYLSISCIPSNNYGFNKTN